MLTYAAQMTGTEQAKYVALLLGTGLHMCPHTAICVLILVCTCVLILLRRKCVTLLLGTGLYMCPLTAVCVLILLYMCPHTAIYVSSYCYICVLILPYMCRHTDQAKYVASLVGTGPSPPPPLGRLQVLFFCRYRSFFFVIHCKYTPCCALIGFRPAG
jgi:hypothetical protein